MHLESKDRKISESLRCPWIMKSLPGESGLHSETLSKQNGRERELCMLRHYHIIRFRSDELS